MNTEHEAPATEDDFLSESRDCEPRLFVHLTLTDVADDCRIPDADGYSFYIDREFARIPVDAHRVRVLADPDLAREQCAALLRRLADWLVRNTDSWPVPRVGVPDYVALESVYDEDGIPWPAS